MVKNRLKWIKIILLGIVLIMFVACQQHNPTKKIPSVAPKTEDSLSRQVVYEPAASYSVQDVPVILLCSSEDDEHLSCKSKPVKAALKEVKKELSKANFRVFMGDEPRKNVAITSYLSISTDQVKRGDGTVVVYVYLDLKAVDSAANGQEIATVDKEDKFLIVVEGQNSMRNKAKVAEGIAKQGGHQLAEQIAKHLAGTPPVVAVAHTKEQSERLPESKLVNDTNTDAVNKQTSPWRRFPGEYYALVIGINSYQHVSKLHTAVDDAREVAKVLNELYGFSVTMLLNQQATRDGIMSAFNQLSKILTEKDHLLIYYAGHGYYDKSGEASFWLPVNGKENEDTKWINSASITTHLRRNKATNILVVADSCYSGTLTRSNNINLDSIPAERRRYLKKMLEKKSRVLIASGGNEPVSDGGGQGHSIFAQVFLEALRQIKETAFTAEELFIKQRIQERVAGRVRQTPEFQIIRNSGHDSGDFVFQRR
jgi:hypothetical protein